MLPETTEVQSRGNIRWRIWDKLAIPHFEGYYAVLIRLEPIPVERAQPVIIEAWLARAAARLSARYLGQPRG